MNSGLFHSLKKVDQSRNAYEETKECLPTVDLTLCSDSVMGLFEGIHTLNTFGHVGGSMVARKTTREAL